MGSEWIFFDDDVPLISLSRAQWVLFSAVIRGNVLVLKYWHNASDAQQSLESLSIEQLLRFRDWSSPDYQISRRVSRFALSLLLPPLALVPLSLPTRGRVTVSSIAED